MPEKKEMVPYDTLMAVLFANRQELTELINAIPRTTEKKEETYYTGQQFVYKYSGVVSDTMIVSGAVGHVLMVDLGDGSRWGGGGTAVRDVQHITQPEFAAICCNNPEYFTRKEKP